MRVFLTGATGFIGRHLATALAAEGHSVLCLVRDPSKSDWMRTCPGVEVVRGDLLDESALRACSGRADLVFHLAGCTSAVSRETYVAVNGHGTGKLAAAVASAAAPSVKIVYLSTLSVAGPRTAANPAREEEPPEPISTYGRSKLLGEELLRRHCSDRPWTIIRAPVVYGPHDRDVLLMFRLAAKGIILQVAGVRTELSLIHVKDMVRALILAGLRGPADGKVYYVSDGHVYTRDDVARHLRAAAGRGFALPVPPALMKVAGLVCDMTGRITGRPALLNSERVSESIQPGWVCRSARIEKDLGFSPGIAMAEGFPSTFRWYREQGWL